MATSSINYTNFTGNLEGKVEVTYEQNTYANLSSKHFELKNSKTGKSLQVEAHPFAARYVNFNNLEQTGKFDADKSKHKWQLQLKEGVPLALNKIPADKKTSIVENQKDCIEVFKNIHTTAVRAMFEQSDCAVLQKKIKQLRKMLTKQGASGDELARLTWEMFLDQSQSGLMEYEDGSIDIKLKTNAYRRDGDDLVPKFPTLLNSVTSVPIDLDNEANIINRDAFISPLVSIKAYYTPTGTYGTTLGYRGGVMWKNGPEYNGGMEFTDYSFGTESTEPSPKRTKVSK